MQDLSLFTRPLDIFPFIVHNIHCLYFSVVIFHHSSDLCPIIALPCQSLTEVYLFYQVHSRHHHSHDYRQNLGEGLGQRGDDVVVALHQGQAVRAD